MKAKPRSYVICSTPRTGSTLLCGLLSSTGVAGRPESYFRRQDDIGWAARWGICGPDGNFDLADYFQAATEAGKSPNGVFAARVMWGTLDEMLADLRRLYPEEAGDDLAVLTAAFGPMRFVYLRRDDLVAQAVSRVRAEETEVWFETDDSQPVGPVARPRFDAERISRYVREAEEHNAAWQAWFHSVGTEPHKVVYEDLDADPVATTLRVLDYLDIRLPPSAVVTPKHRRLADALSAEWAARYEASTRRV